MLTVQAVYEALPKRGEPIYYRDLCTKLGIPWGEPSDAFAEAREALKFLHRQGRAEIVFGQGWRRTASGRQVR